MKHRTMLKALRTAAFAAAMCMAFGTIARADDYYYGRQDEAREQGYRAGYQDGLRNGRNDSAHGFRYNYKSEQWEDADDGYQHWMGSKGRYKRAYRDGYVSGYQRGFGRGYRDDYRGRDRDDWRWRDRDDWR